MKKYTIKRINSQIVYDISIEENLLAVTAAGEKSLFHFQAGDNITQVESNEKSKDTKTVAIETLFSHFPEAATVSFNNEESYLRETFFQQAGIWNAPTNPHFPLEEWTETKEVRHPKRPPFKANQALYSRYVGLIDSTISIRVIDESDLDIFHQWHNQPRVANFWELAHSKEEIAKYIQKGLNDPHQMPVIIEINGEAAGYFEIYWTREDRLGPYYESDAFDRGIHLLIGNTKFLGFNNTDAILKSVAHFIFLDDPRTRRIMGEPRHDNQKMLKYVLTFKAWRRVKEFDFPHKRAVLLECSRELMFQGHYL